MANKHKNIVDSDTPDFNALLGKVGQTKDRESFVTLFEHFAPRLKFFLMKGGITEELADELAQETMLTIWQKAGSYNPAQAAASTWIFTIARNKRIDAFRKNKHFHVDIDDTPGLVDEKADPTEGLDRTREEEDIAGALEALPEEQAYLIKKSFFEEKSHAVIAEEEGIPLGTVKSRIRLALERLRAEGRINDLWD